MNHIFFIHSSANRHLLKSRVFCNENINFALIRIEIILKVMRLDVITQGVSTDHTEKREALDRMCCHAGIRDTEGAAKEPEKSPHEEEQTGVGVLGDSWTNC